VIPNLDVDQLKTFLAIAETGSFTKAAEEVNKTQSAVSMQMKRLEETIGRALFARDGRGSRFTLEGERFIEHARKIVSVNDEIVTSYSRPEITGTVRFGTSDDYAEQVLPDVLVRFHRSNPLVTVDVECISSTHLSELVKRGEIDLALVTFCDACDSGEVLKRGELHWATSARHSTHLADSLALATADVSCSWRRRAVQALDSVSRKHRIGFTSPNRAAIDAAVLQGLAVAAMPDICLRPGMRVLTETDGFPPLGSYEIGLLRKAGRLSQAAEALARHVRESFGKQAINLVAAE
jgi:DNA-binding transcriptional LysR family regulator